MSEAQPNEVDYTFMTGPDLLTALGDDASRWAAAFCQHAKRLGHTDIDEGWMIGWFANAIEHSSDVRRWRGKPQTQPLADRFPS